MRQIHYIMLAAVAAAVISCVDKEELDGRLDDLQDRIVALENAVSAVNGNAVAVSRLLKDSTIILSYEKNGYGYVLELNSDIVEICFGAEAPGIVPVIGIDDNGHWVCSVDNGKTFTKIEGSMTPDSEASPVPMIRKGSDNYWEISADGGQTWKRITDTEGKPVSSSAGNADISAKTIFEKIALDEQNGTFTFTMKSSQKDVIIPVVSSFTFSLKNYTDGDIVTTEESKTYAVESDGVKDVAIQTSEGWNAVLKDGKFTVTAPSQAGLGKITLILVSDKGYVRTINFSFMALGLDETACNEWNNFVMKNDDNVLLDFSYAGYRYGEYAPAAVESLGYTQYNIKDYYSSGQTTDREAFIAALTAALGSPEISSEAITFPDTPSARSIIYFPEGEYTLHKDSDENSDLSIIIRAGDFVLKGAGRDKTAIIMETPMQAADENVLYSSPDMIQLKHNTGLEFLADVTGNASKGEFNVTANSVAGLSEGKWVCLYVWNNSPEFVTKEVAPYQPDVSWDISTNGVKVIEYHQIRSISGNTVTFFEPIMHEVDAQWGWKIMNYSHYANTGVEDLTFKGNAPSDFSHHFNWVHDGGYKPLSMNRLVNSWIRRVRFESVSEACSIINSANVSAYDIEMTGNRGHASVRAQASTRVLIAGTTDKTSDGSGMKGNFHGVGVSEHSIGTVLWRNIWGDDSCFESHCKQPRATLIDCCTGGWNGTSQGGDKTYAPHHLADLSIWNFEATSTEAGEFFWWRDTPSWLKILPPVVVGFRSPAGMTFNQEQTTVISSHGMQTSPESLYEAQLRLRTGSVPSWLNNLK